MPTPKSILALDFGHKRVGVAITGIDARLPRPLTTLPFNDHFLGSLQQIIRDENVTAIVVGLPRNMEGMPTQQTQQAQAFGQQLSKLGLPIHFQDEALTSRKAEAELQASHRRYTKAEIDALAATYILEDFLGDYPEVNL